MQKLPITVIIISQAGNEQLEGAISSVSWAAEVIVKKESQKILDFAALRNEAIALAHQPIIFFLDSDEQVEDQAPKKLATLINQSDWNGATILRQDIFLGKQMKWGEVRDVQILRIFRQGTFHFERPVHEIAYVTGQTKASEIIILHNAHQSISAFFSKIINYIQLEVELRKTQDHQVSLFELFAWPVGKFIVNYFFKLGLLDGWRGLTYALMMSIHSFGIRATLYELQHQDKNSIRS